MWNSTAEGSLYTDYETATSHTVTVERAMAAYRRRRMSSSKW